MYRGSRLAASLLLVLTGLVATAVALFIVPPAVSRGAAWLLVPVAIVGATLHFIALVGLARGGDWGRGLAVLVAEIGGGVAILGGVAMAIGSKPFGADATTGLGLLAWTAATYAVLGIAAGRVPVLARLTPLERRRVVLGPSFAGVA